MTRCGDGRANEVKVVNRALLGGFCGIGLSSMSELWFVLHNETDT